MFSFLFAPLTILVKLYLFSDEFLVFAGPVIYALAVATRQFYKSILGHGLDTNINQAKLQLSLLLLCTREAYQQPEKICLNFRL